MEPSGCNNDPSSTRRTPGFSLIELLVVVAIILIMCVMSYPLIRSTLAYYDLQNAVASLSGAVNSTRYRAIADGYPYRLKLNMADASYQLASDPGWLPTNAAAPSFADTGKAVSLGKSIVVGADIAIEFYPSGKIVFATGSSPFTISRPITDTKTTTKKFTVSNYGSVKVE